MASKLNKATPAVIVTAIERAVHTLKVTGCRYKIIAPDGAEFGDLVVKSTTGRTYKKRNPDLKQGAIKAYFLPYVKDVKVGEVAAVPISDTFGLDSLRSGLTAWASLHWGKGTYTSCMSKDRKSYEILRTG